MLSLDVRVDVFGGEKERVTKSASRCQGFWDIIGGGARADMRFTPWIFWKRNPRPISEATRGMVRQRLRAPRPCQNLLNLDVVAKKKKTQSIILQQCGLFHTSNLIRDGFYLVQEKFNNVATRNPMIVSLENLKRMVIELFWGKSN